MKKEKNRIPTKAVSGPSISGFRRAKNKFSSDRAAQPQDLGCNGGADVGPHDDADSLPRLRMPALTNPMHITVVAAEEWTIPATTAPSGHL